MTETVEWVDGNDPTKPAVKVTLGFARLSGLWVAWRLDGLATHALGLTKFAAKIALLAGTSEQRYEPSPN